MHTETLRNERGGVKTFLKVLGLVLGIALAVSVAGAIDQTIAAAGGSGSGNAAGLRVVEYAVLALMLVVAYLLIKRELTDYRYTLAEGVLYFERVVGTRARILEKVPLEDAFALVEQGEAGSASLMRATFLKDGAKVLLYRRYNRDHGVAFHPTPQLAELLEKQLRGAPEETQEETQEDA